MSVYDDIFADFYSDNADLGVSQFDAANSLANYVGVDPIETEPTYEGQEMVGTPTGDITRYGRSIYETPGGEFVSEKSTTLDLGDGRIANVPTIHGGYSYSNSDLERMLSNNEIDPTSLHTNIPDAVKAAKARSDGMSGMNIIQQNPYVAKEPPTSRSWNEPGGWGDTLMQWIPGVGPVYGGMRFLGGALDERLRPGTIWDWFK